MFRLLPACIAVLGVLGAAAGQRGPWRDSARHRGAFAERDGVRLHYLEWGGNGPAIVLLPGYSLTAHAFDDVAARLSPTYRVIAVTPRGFGESDAPRDSSYVIATLIADLGAVLDALHVERATIVGHSLSGTVAARFALERPERVRQLVMLDAFPYFTEEGGDSIEALDPVSVPDFAGDTTYDAVAKYLARYRFVPFQPAMEADLRSKPMGPESERRREVTYNYITDQWRSPPDLRKLQVPSVQLCAWPSTASEYPWIPRSDPAYARADRYVAGTLTPFARRLCTRYAATVPQGRTIDVQGSHYVFFTRPSETAALLRRVISAR